jgi:hypothetical protein
MRMSRTSQAPTFDPAKIEIELPAEYRTRIGLTIPEIQGMVPWGRSSIYAAIKCGDLAVIKLGRRTFVTTASFVARLEKGSAAC